MNSHGGQPQIIEIAARDLHVKYEDFLIFPLFTWRVPNIAGELLTPKEKELGIHAGDLEGKLPFAWTTRDLSQTGVLGDPIATQEKGRILESVSNGWVQVIQDVYKFRQPTTL